MLIFSASSQAAERRVSVAVLDFGEAEAGRGVADRVAKLLDGAEGAGLKLALVDRGLARAAARGLGYKGSLNMTLDEARDLGAAIGCHFYLTGDAQVVRRSPSSAPVYYEAYASVFVVSARTGRLILWDRPAAEAATPEQASASLLAELDSRVRARYAAAVFDARAQEESPAGPESADAPGEFEDLTSDEPAGARAGLREPQPFRRLRPAYPETAARAEAEATVDAAVEVGADGEVRRVEIVRWAGFGLDESVVSTVRRLHFRPATRDGTPMPVRVLLRYNFRRPPPAAK